MKMEIKTGDIVEIKNAYFKNDNGIYFVDNALAILHGVEAIIH